MAADYKVTGEELPDGKWACFLHVPGFDQPFDLGKQFKSEERAELWLNVSEATTAIEMVLAKCREEVEARRSLGTLDHDQIIILPLETGRGEVRDARAQHSPVDLGRSRLAGPVVRMSSDRGHTFG